MAQSDMGIAPPSMGGSFTRGFVGGMFNAALLGLILSGVALGLGALGASAGISWLAGMKGIEWSFLLVLSLSAGIFNGLMNVRREAQDYNLARLVEHQQSQQPEIAINAGIGRGAQADMADPSLENPEAEIPSEQANKRWTDKLSANRMASNSRIQAIIDQGQKERENHAKSLEAQRERDARMAQMNGIR